MTTIAARAVSSESGLRRELGRWDLTAIGINQVIGSAVFALPAVLAASCDGWSPLLILAVGVASLLIAATFAEVGSRFDVTGGPYIYTRAAFGRFIGFEIGWVQWFIRVSSWAAVLNVFVAYSGFYWPSAASGMPRVVWMSSIVVSLAAINVLGIKQSAWTVNSLTIGKLVPLLLFVVVGLTAMNWASLRPGALPPISHVSSSALLLIYGFGGYETILIPAGESRAPRTGVPFALVTTILVVSAIFVLVQIVSMGTLPGLATSTTPLADAAARLRGAPGAAIIMVGALLSVLGNNMGAVLSGSRSLFALAEHGDVPAVFGFVSARFKTPVVAIVTTSAVSLILATTGTFVTLASASAVSRLMLYGGTCGAALRLRGGGFASRVEDVRFRVPFGRVIPIAVLVILAAIFFGATAPQIMSGAIVLAVGAVLFAVAILTRRGA